MSSNKCIGTTNIYKKRRKTEILLIILQQEGHQLAITTVGKTKIRVDYYCIFI